MQVHPPASVVDDLPGAHLKTESWIVVRADEGAEIMLGVVDGVTPDDLEAIACPSLLLYGESSDILDRAFVLEDAIPGTVLEIVDGCSHALLMEDPATVERFTIGWLDEQARAAQASADRSVATG